MQFYERYQELCSSYNLTPQAGPLMAKIQVTSGTISGWKKGHIPKLETLCLIADYFNVTTDYLLGRTDVRIPAITDLTADELLIIEQYRNCSDESQASIRNVINSFCQSSPKSSHPESSTSKIG